MKSIMYCNISLNCFESSLVKRRHLKQSCSQCATLQCLSPQTLEIYRLTTCTPVSCAMQCRHPSCRSLNFKLRGTLQAANLALSCNCS
jgi:hypothetical protein